MAFEISRGRYVELRAKAGAESCDPVLRSIAAELREGLGIDPEFAQGSKLTEADRYPKSETEAAELLKNAKTTEERQRIFKLLIGKVKLPINTKLVTEGPTQINYPGSPLPRFIDFVVSSPPIF
ncbi:hypothetical protein PPACK8108_LOCUS9700 [Phakopsora pachyrhizi]|uniref:Uncharacterized protein n=1 Tax=Phakopsora pachyrhizi TaxID=170000 RepID=A0AAV0AWX5_PHAPC|nr:hypothetical protein PPACK8108_LOCUS9700 [Phakopsora pachyrhizi]